MKVRKYDYYMCDFETTVYDGQVSTEVWASASVKLFTEDVIMHHSIEETFDYFSHMKGNQVLYYHNLKFDGAFWLDYLITKKGFNQAYDKTGIGQYDITWKKDKDMYNNTFKYSISDKGMFYTIVIKVNNKFIEIRDSMKLLPFSVERIGKSFGTKHKKLDMEYSGFRYAGCEITEKEQEYIKNDVLVVKEALEIMFQEGHNKLTIGSCCLSEYKNIINKNTTYDYDALFPNIYEINVSRETFGVDTAGDFVKKSYKGGWCYLVKGKENKVSRNGLTADVNSLYPSMMHSESGNYYPVGKPCFWNGDYIPDQALKPERYYFIKIRTRFKLKENYLPCIQIKGNFLYRGTEWLETSDVYDKATGKYYDHYIDKDGNVVPAYVELTLTMTDWELIQEHYELIDCEIIGGCWFYAMKGIFDEYINKYKEIKTHSKGAKRESAKLFLNNLYGKLASSKDSSFKVAYVKDDKSIGFVTVHEYEKEPGYIPCGSAITSYARNFTIRAAQKNYRGKDKSGFIYADTDSIHCDLSPDDIKGIKVHPTDFCCWKLESCWDNAIFVRQKTYIEHVTHEDVEKIENPYYNVKCAGMPQKSKDLFILSMTGKADIRGYKDKNGDMKEWSKEEYEFLFDADDKPIKRTIHDFKVGLKVPDKLLPKRISGGILLVNSTYEMR